jgi:hypothetical protein
MGPLLLFVDIDSRWMDPLAFRLIHRLYIRSGIISDVVTLSEDGAVFTRAYQCVVRCTYYEALEVTY